MLEQKILEHLKKEISSPSDMYKSSVQDILIGIGNCPGGRPAIIKKLKRLILP